MRALALLAIAATLAGCTAPDSRPGETIAPPTGDASEGECPSIPAAFVKLNLTGMPGNVREATLVARPDESLRSARPDCGGRRSLVPLSQGVAIPVEKGWYRELRIASDVGVARVALDLPVQIAATLDVELAPGAASARFNDARLLVTRAEIVEDPAAYSRVQVDATAPIDDSVIAVRHLTVASPWNDGISVSFGVRPHVEATPESREALSGLRVVVRVFAPNGTLAASRAIDGAAVTDGFAVPAPAAGEWRIELDTTPPARPYGKGDFHFDAVVAYDGPDARIHKL